MNSWLKSSAGNPLLLRTHNLHLCPLWLQVEEEDNIKANCFVHLCYLPSKLMRFDGRPPALKASAIRCVMRHTSSSTRINHRIICPHSPHGPSSLLPLLCIFGRNVIPGRSQSRTRGTAHQRWHIAWRKRPSCVLPMERREWHLYHHCPLQFVINHANIPKSPILSPFHVWVPDSKLCAGYTREH